MDVGRLMVRVVPQIPSVPSEPPPLPHARLSHTVRRSFSASDFYSEHRLAAT